MSGFTADEAVSSTNTWKQMQKNNVAILLTTTAKGVGGIMYATAETYTPAMSQDMLYDSFVISLLESRTIGAPGININYLSSQLSNAETTSVLNLAGVTAYTLAGENVAANQAIQGWVPHFAFETYEGTDGQQHRAIGQWQEKDTQFTGIAPNGDQVSKDWNDGLQVQSTDGSSRSEGTTYYSADGNLLRLVYYISLDYGESDGGKYFWQNNDDGSAYQESKFPDKSLQTVQTGEEGD